MDLVSCQASATPGSQLWQLEPLSPLAPLHALCSQDACLDGWEFVANAALQLSEPKLAYLLLECSGDRTPGIGSKTRKRNHSLAPVEAPAPCTCAEPTQDPPGNGPGLIVAGLGFRIKGLGFRV